MSVQSKWLLGFIAALTAIAYSAFRTRTKRDAARRRAATWGRAQPARGGVDQIARYHRTLTEALPEAADASLADQEWRDLGMDAMFSELDRTSSAPGQQLLYHRLRTPSRTNEQFSALGHFETLAHRFSDDIASRERAQAALVRLDDSAAYALPRLFLGPLPAKPRFAWVFFPLAIAPLLALLAALTGLPHGWVILLMLLCVNYVARSIVAADVAWIGQPIRALHTLLEVAADLAKDKDANHTVAGARARLTRLRRITALTAIADGGDDDVVRVFVDYFNLLFLIDINVFIVALRECERRRGDIRAVFEWVGDVDAALAVASFRAGRADWCRPTILSIGSGIIATAVAHPLLTDPRKNDVSVQPARGMVITGSNMSGKTTLLRALGVNALLAQTIHTCIATRFACPPLAIRTAIALSDSLLAGESYYLAEARNALGMVAADGRVQHLFLIDELFRGTNTTERIATGVAVMEALLSNSSMAIVATHDSEVVDLVEDRYDPRHFSETITEEGFTFDFMLRPGPATQQNAVSLLRVLGAPDSLVDRATQLCAKIEGDAADTPLVARLC